MNQQQIQQMCQLAEKSGLYNDMKTYKATVSLSVAQAKIVNPLSPNVEEMLQFNAAMRNAELAEELLMVDELDEEEVTEE